MGPRPRLPLLPTTVVGSYSVPEWLERLKNDFYQRRISAQHLADIHDVAIKAALKDQELAGVDIVSDGELRRDNDIDYLLGRIPGVSIAHRVKTDYFDYYDADVIGPLPAGGDLGLAADFAFTRQNTAKPIKFSFTGPFSLSRRLRRAAGVDEESLVFQLAAQLNAEARTLAAAGASLLQVDEPFLGGYPAQTELAVAALNVVTAGVDAHWALHICYGNRNARPLWAGHYDFLFPAVLGANVQQLVLEFARKGQDDLRTITDQGWHRAIGLGVIDVKSAQIESADLVADRIRHALKYVPAERLFINPDCGLRHVPGPVAQAKLRAMTGGAAAVRRELRRRASPASDRTQPPTATRPPAATTGTPS
jgi:5-methyltetrahydropteroyltriglutamate--homocysteine methyltransferase